MSWQDEPDDLDEAAGIVGRVLLVAIVLVMAAAVLAGCAGSGLSSKLSIVPLQWELASSQPGMQLIPSPRWPSPQSPARESSEGDDAVPQK